MYQQSKTNHHGDETTTDGLLSPFQLGEQEQDEKELRAYISQMKESLTNEFPTIVHTPIFAKTFKQSIRDRINTYENKWGVSVVV
jgi:predicted metal-dependent TIM-barrel fold hydrolase